jgi:hypothetical protein
MADVSTLISQPNERDSKILQRFPGNSLAVQPVERGTQPLTIRPGGYRWVAASASTGASSTTLTVMNRVFSCALVAADDVQTETDRHRPIQALMRRDSLFRQA